MIRFPVSKPSLTNRERSLLLAAFDSGQITQGPLVEDFERRLADYLNVGYAVACSSGTTALHLATAAFLEPGDEVLVPDLTFVATVNAVCYANAVPVLCDIDPIDWSISLDDAEKKLSARTKAIVVVHLYGQAANMTAIVEFAEKHGLVVIEDAAEGLGGKFGANALGTMGEAGTFSFFGNKIITTGEGGAVVTEDEELAAQFRLLRGQGQTDRRYFHSTIGFNYRMTELQAALGIAQLGRIDELIAQREDVMSWYREWAEQLDLVHVRAESAPWLFTFQVPRGIKRKALQDALLSDGIDTRTTFVPMHELPMFERPGAQFPVATDFGSRGLSLPTYPGLSWEDVRYITDSASIAMRRHSLKGVS